MDLEGTDDKAIRLTDEGGLELAQALKQKPLALAFAGWIKPRADIRTAKQSNFIHGKMYHVARSSKATAASVGSFNFTRRGLGLGQNPNIDLNLARLRSSIVEPKTPKAETKMETVLRRETSSP